MGVKKERPAQNWRAFDLVEYGRSGLGEGLAKGATVDRGQLGHWRG